MKVIQTNLPGCLVFEPQVFGDERGFFYESFNRDKLAAKAGIGDEYNATTRAVDRLSRQIEKVTSPHVTKAKTAARKFTHDDTKAQKREEERRRAAQPEPPADTPNVRTDAARKRRPRRKPAGQMVAQRIATNAAVKVSPPQIRVAARAARMARAGNARRNRNRRKVDA